MKRFCVIFIALFAFISGCSNNEVPKIDDYIWQMSSIQATEEKGQVIAYGGSKNNSGNDNAVELQLECAAKGGVLTINDKTNNEAYTGSYQFIDSDRKSTMYKVSLEECEGTAVISFTTYHDGTLKPTFIIGLENYTINFSSDSLSK
ncbi:MAG TPA: hypothetical protein VFD52_00460 [Clostridia bacterium]|nr:hypothetical protein [Clostridia bacterium]